MRGVWRTRRGIVERMRKTTKKLIDRTKRTFAAELRQQREAAGLTQREVAARAKMPERSYQKMEAGEASVTIDAMARVSRALGVDATVLLGGPRR